MNIQASLTLFKMPPKPLWGGADPMLRAMLALTWVLSLGAMGYAIHSMLEYGELSLWKILAATAAGAYLLLLAAGTLGRGLVLSLGLLWLCVFWAITLVFFHHLPPTDALVTLRSVDFGELRGLFGLLGLDLPLLGLALFTLFGLGLAFHCPGSRIRRTRRRGYTALALLLGLHASPFITASSQIGLVSLALNGVFGHVLYVAGMVHVEWTELVESGRSEYLQVTPQATSHGPQIHILVIGESARRDAFSLYGYAVPTTPHLADWQAQGRLLAWTDVTAAAPFTAIAVPQLLAGREPGLLVPTLMDYAKAGGYTTTWAANQDTSTMHHANVVADKVFYPVNAVFQGFNSQPSLDEVLLPQVTVDDKPRFIVLHTVGSHFTYKDRYPKNGCPFENRHYADAERDEYDCSILYTDQVLHRLLSLLEDTRIPATVTYVSDHGEAFPSTDNGNHGHGHSREVAPHVWQVPLLLWANRAWRAAHQTEWTAFERIRSEPQSARATFDLMRLLLQV